MFKLADYISFILYVLYLVYLAFRNLSYAKKALKNLEDGELNACKYNLQEITSNAFYIYAVPIYFFVRYVIYFGFFYD